MCFGHTNSTLGVSLSLDNAIMYMQNVLSVIEHKISNEIRYSLAFKQIVSKQIARMDITQQVFYEDLKSLNPNSPQTTSEETSQKDPSNDKNIATKQMIIDLITRQQIPCT